MNYPEGVVIVTTPREPMTGALDIRASPGQIIAEFTEAELLALKRVAQAQLEMEKRRGVNQREEGG